MIKNWKNLSWVVLLAWLQCFAPLLHAHMLGNSDSSAIHFHSDDDMLDHVVNTSGEAEVNVSKTTGPAIGIAHQFKKEYAFFLAVDHAPIPAVRLAANYGTLPIMAEQTYQSPRCFAYLFPLSHAPPAFLP